MSVYVPGDNETDLKKIIRSIKQISAGRSNGTGTLTLTISVTSTTVLDRNCSADSWVLPIATTAHAAAEIGNGTMYLSAVANGSFTFTHASNTQADRTFGYIIVG